MLDLPSLCPRARLGPASPSALALVIAVVLACLACPGPAPLWPEHEGFDDHSVATIDSVARFEALARRSPAGTAALKFIIVDFERDRPGQVRYLDSAFYEYHDQWYWFRLLNGAAIPGVRTRPQSGLSLPTVAAAIEWVSARERPVYDLRWVDGRLYSDRFYELGVRRDDPVLGLGTLLHLPARTEAPTRPALWAFELEYGEAVDAERLAGFFTHLRATLPATIADELHYLARSPDQAQLVAELRRQRDPLAERLTSYAELAVPGEVQVYNPGLIAGRLRRMPDDPERAAALLTAGDPRAIWMMAGVPDELPAAAGLLTAVPQTPLAHINLLARDRQIPNAYLGGLLDDPQLDQLARVHAPVIVHAQASGALDIVPIDEADYARWLGLQRPAPPRLEPLALERLPYTVDLEREDLADVSALRPVVGGKAAGFIVLHAAGVETPERPVAISVRAYAEHLEPLREDIVDALGDPSFGHDARVRYLVLEGREDFDERFSSASDQDWVARFVADHPPSAAERDGIAALLARGGIRHAIRERPIDPPTAAAIDEALRAQFGHFAATQGLRFRSSSTIEDVEGFSGAGLYDSNTGFLAPTQQARKKDRKKDVAWALRKTWASYWSWEAFEERRRAGLDHLAGGMAVLVHARFDDELELANGVATLTYDRRGLAPRAPVQHPRPALARLEINSQAGALSVTNPPPELAGEALPEVVILDQPRVDARATSTRVAASTQAATVLDDAELRELLASTTAIAERWLELDNLALDPARARSRVSLDFEFKRVAPAWPATSEARERAAGPRLIIKQVRSLDPGIAGGAAGLIRQPIPRELLLFAERIEVHRCRGARTRLDVLEVWTDPMTPALGHADAPFVARVRLEVHGSGGVELDHRALTRVDHPGLGSGAPWAVDLELDPAASGPAGLRRVHHRGGLIQITRDGGPPLEEPAACSVEVLFASPDAFLRSLIGD